MKEFTCTAKRPWDLNDGDPEGTLHPDAEEVIHNECPCCDYFRCPNCQLEWKTDENGEPGCPIQPPKIFDCYRCKRTFCCDHHSIKDLFRDRLCGCCLASMNDQMEDWWKRF